MNSSSLSHFSDEKGADMSQFIDESIRSILFQDPKPLTTSKRPLFNSDLTFNWENLNNSLGIGTSFLPMDDLIDISSECEKVLFDTNANMRNKLPKPIRGMILLAENTYESKEQRVSHTLISTLLALNFVEASVRELNSQRNGRAPLLKDMIENISESGYVEFSLLASMLRSLLLPNDGINLRNLLWHGFVTYIPRRWLALCIVLILSIEKMKEKNPIEVLSMKRNDNSDMKSLFSFSKHDELRHIIDNGKALMSSVESIEALESLLNESQIVPTSHQSLLRVALTSYSHLYPVCFSAVMVILLEHFIRIIWCDSNERIGKIARPGDYYVTLDGIGQRYKHDVVLHPYCSFPVNEDDHPPHLIQNKLVQRFGASTMALLTDLFASPRGRGPNIRASLAHGSYNEFLSMELELIADNGHEKVETFKVEPLNDLSYILVSSLKLISRNRTKQSQSYTDEWDRLNAALPYSEKENTYRPLFSYTSSIVKSIENLFEEIVTLRDIGKSITQSSTSLPLFDNKQICNITAACPSANVNQLFYIRKQIHNELGINYQGESWTAEDLFLECQHSSELSKCGAAHLLVSEIVSAISSQRKELNRCLNEFSERSTSSRRRKQISKTFSMTKVTLDLYSLASWIAMLYISRRLVGDSHYTFSNMTESTLLQAVKRSRMVVSTFSTSSNTDRALKALSQYMASKQVKAVMKSGVIELTESK